MSGEIITKIYEVPLLSTISNLLLKIKLSLKPIVLKIPETVLLIEFLLDFFDISVVFGIVLIIIGSSILVFISSFFSLKSLFDILNLFSIS